MESGQSRPGPLGCRTPFRSAKEHGTSIFPTNCCSIPSRSVVENRSGSKLGGQSAVAGNREALNRGVGSSCNSAYFTARGWFLRFQRCVPSRGASVQWSSKYPVTRGFGDRTTHRNGDGVRPPETSILKAARRVVRPCSARAQPPRRPGTVRRRAGGLCLRCRPEKSTTMSKPSVLKRGSTSSKCPGCAASTRTGSVLGPDPGRPEIHDGFLDATYCSRRARIQPWAGFRTEFCVSCRRFKKRIGIMGETRLRDIRRCPGGLDGLEVAGAASVTLFKWRSNGELRPCAPI